MEGGKKEGRKVTSMREWKRDEGTKDREKN